MKGVRNSGRWVCGGKPRRTWASSCPAPPARTQAHLRAGGAYLRATADGHFVLEHGADLVTQFRRVLMAMDGDGMLRRCTHHLLFLPGDGQGAATLTGELATIRHLTRHRASYVGAALTPRTCNSVLRWRW